MRMHDVPAAERDITILFLHPAGQALHSVLGSWVSRRFFGGCAVLFPMVVTVYITWWFLTFFDNFFSVGLPCAGVPAAGPAGACMATAGADSTNLTSSAVPMQPVYEALFGFHVFGLGFVTSMAFIIGTGLQHSCC